jgi:hypothetical protein
VAIPWRVVYSSTKPNDEIAVVAAPLFQPRRNPPYLLRAAFARACGAGHEVPAHFQVADQHRFVSDVAYQARSDSDGLGIVACDRHADAPIALNARTIRALPPSRAAGALSCSMLREENMTS